MNRPWLNRPGKWKKKCKNCGNEFTTTVKNRRCCDDKECIKDRKNKNYKRWRERHPDKKNKYSLDWLKNNRERYNELARYYT